MKGKTKSSKLRRYPFRAVRGDTQETVINKKTYSIIKSYDAILKIEALEHESRLQKEKNAMQKIWKEREKQLEKVLLNTTNFYGSVKGIAGNAIGDIKLLELGGEND